MAGHEAVVSVIMPVYNADITKFPFFSIFLNSNMQSC